MTWARHAVAAAYRGDTEGDMNPMEGTLACLLARTAGTASGTATSSTPSAATNLKKDRTAHSFVRPS
jgi:hypothetical protein